MTLRCVVVTVTEKIQLKFSKEIIIHRLRAVSCRNSLISTEVYHITIEEEVCMELIMDERLANLAC